MSLKTLLDDRLISALKERMDTGDIKDTPGEVAAQIVIDLLKEHAIRGEVYEAASYMNGAAEGFSIVDVHNVLDALIVSLEGGATDDASSEEGRSA